MAGWARWILAFAAGVLVIADFVRIDSASHSVSDTLINWVPQTAVIVLLAVVLGAAIDRVAARRGL
jgi:hypothetical protein